jgi:parallel beta-helix repeat protein
MLDVLRRVVPWGVVFVLSACGGGGGSPPAAPPPPNPLYVRTSGKDTNTGGDPDNALRTISKAASLVRNGYKVIVGSGTYREGVTTTAAGVAPQGLTFLADTTGEQTGDLAGPVILNGTGTGDGAGFNLFNSGGTVIDGFTITNFSDAGIVIKSSSDNLRIQNCIIFSNPGDGIRVQDSANVLVFNNLIYSNGGSGVALVGPTAGSPNGHVINNTIFANQFRGLTVGTSTRASTGAFVRNNIVQNDGTDFSIKVFTPPPSTVPRSDIGYDADFNLVFPATYLPSNVEGRHDVARDAQFVNAANGDFHLRSASPAINVGFSLTDTYQPLQNALRGRTTTGGTACDQSALDLGYHYPLPPGGRCTAVVP